MLHKAELFCCCPKGRTDPGNGFPDLELVTEDTSARPTGDFDRVPSSGCCPIDPGGLGDREITREGSTVTKLRPRNPMVAFPSRYDGRYRVDRLVRLVP